MSSHVFNINMKKDANISLEEQEVKLFEGPNKKFQGGFDKNCNYDKVVARINKIDNDAIIKGEDSEVSWFEPDYWLKNFIHL